MEKDDTVSKFVDAALNAEWDLEYFEGHAPGEAPSDAARVKLACLEHMRVGWRQFCDAQTAPLSERGKLARTAIEHCHTASRLALGVALKVQVKVWDKFEVEYGELHENGELKNVPGIPSDDDIREARLCAEEEVEIGRARAAARKLDKFTGKLPRLEQRLGPKKWRRIWKAWTVPRVLIAFIALVMGGLGAAKCSATSKQTAGSTAQGVEGKLP